MQLRPNMGPRVMTPVGSTAGERLFSDARTTSGVLAAVAFIRDGQDELPAFLTGKAEAALARRSWQTNEVYGQEMFATIAAERETADFVNVYQCGGGGAE